MEPRERHSSTALLRPSSPTGAPVYVHIYDLFWTNNYTYNLGVGFYHSGVEVYGREFGFGGHPFAFSGLFEKVPKDVDELGPNFRYKETVLLGHTDFSPSDIDEMMSALAQEWHGNTYHLVTRNCNHFTQHLCPLLCGQEAPGWINRLANASSRLPSFVTRCLPREWLIPVAVDLTIEDMLGHNVPVEQLRNITFCNKIPPQLCSHASTPTSPSAHSHWQNNFNS